jgi:histidine ammonia-lyase
MYNRGHRSGQDGFRSGLVQSKAGVSGYCSPAMSPIETRVLLDGRTLAVGGVVAMSRRGARPLVAPGAIDAATRAGAALASLPAYGRTTGVGANRDLLIDPGDHGHDLRLWLSHAGASGPLLDEEAVRAMLAVRLNQMLTGRTGMSADCAYAVEAAAEAGALPAVARYGSVGTGDLTALAGLGLCLAGRRPWWHLDGPTPAPFEPHPGDGLALPSSNALTAALAALAAHDLGELSRAAVVVAAMTCLATGASTEAFSPAVWADPTGGPPSGGARVAAMLTELLHGPGQRLQDPYALRAAPVWHGPLLAAIEDLLVTVHKEINRSTENPLVDEATGRWLHHAAIISTELATRLDGVRAALVPAANGSLSRTRLLHVPAISGLAPFLAAGPPGSSGTMIVEYGAAAAAAELAQGAMPSALAWTTLSIGQEDGASFATQGALAAREAVGAFRAVVASELVVAIRALRISGWPGAELAARAAEPLAAAVRAVMEALPAELEDHDLGPELETAAGLLPALAEQVVEGP